MTKWTAPDIASIRGDNSRPLQKIFGSLSEHLKNYENGYTLNSLDDVTITTPSVGQVLSYDATNSLWINTTGSVITNLNASNLASGTVPTGRVSGSYAGITGVGTLGSLAVSGTITNSNGIVELGLGRVTSGFAYVDLIGDSFYGDYGLRLMRGNGGANTYSRLTHRGTGQLEITTEEAAPLIFSTTYAERMRITSAGLVGIGTSSPSTALQVVGTVTATAFAGPLTGNVTGNVSGSAATVTGASQTAITSIGTLTTLLTGQTCSTATVAAANDTGSFSVRGNASFPAVMSFHRTGAYAVNFGLSTANKMELGGWSASTIKFTWDMATGEFISSGRIHAQTDLRVGNAQSAVLTSDLFALIVTPQAYTGLPVRIGEHYNIASVGTTNSQFTVFAGPASGGEVIFKRAANITIGSLNSSGLYLSEGWLRTYDTRGWYCETYGGGINMEDSTYVRVYNGKRFFSPGGYAGNVQYGSYGSLTMYGSNNGYVGITFPDHATTWMSGTNGQIFGIYRNNNTWNFYVSNGTFTPSDERYKRDIEPLQHGMNLIREIVPVTYDPLTEDPSDDPEQTVGRTHYGFTTQNILQALTNAGETRDIAMVDIGGPDSAMNSDRQYLNHSALIAPMVKAIQELDQRLQQLETV